MLPFVSSGVFGLVFDFFCLGASPVLGGHPTAIKPPHLGDPGGFLLPLEALFFQGEVEKLPLTSA